MSESLAPTLDTHDRSRRGTKSIVKGVASTAHCCSLGQLETVNDQFFPFSLSLSLLSVFHLCITRHPIAMDPLAPGNPLSPDSQAFMDLLERHLSDHDDKQRLDVPAAGADMSLFPGMMSGGYTSFSAAGDKQPAMTPGPANAPSPNTMAALINILQVQAQASGADPQAQQRRLVNLLNNMPWNPTSTTPNNPQLDAFAAAMMSQPAAQTNVHPSQLYSQPQPAANQYPYPGIDTPEHSGPGSSSALKHGRSGTESNGNTPPATQSSAGSSPEAMIGSGNTSARLPEGKTAKQVEEHVKRKAGDEEIEGHQSHRTRHGDGGDSHDDGTSPSIHQLQSPNFAVW